MSLVSDARRNAAFVNAVAEAMSVSDQRQAWRDRDPTTLSVRAKRPVMLRICADDNTLIEVSTGYTVRRSDARTIWIVAAAARRAHTRLEWGHRHPTLTVRSAATSGYELSSYELRRVFINGAVHVGCQRISWAELNGFFTNHGRIG